jgi:hypothetical protein
VALPAVAPWFAVIAGELLLKLVTPPYPPDADEGWL